MKVFFPKLSLKTHISENGPSDTYLKKVQTVDNITIFETMKQERDNMELMW